ncbi:cation diffusion facilitator family transporter [Novosphingobium pentaromativorans]|uniref:cation diffusion facilitator family transporter n=2 Tax=Novosphingobium pentaromativorans TaxID=205844 RepID=UPI00051F8143|nr:cation diffusion facilitator family transporter [Novosphingobium pentaromativorans]AIT81954.1 membrane protein [Novosphingobium pentaromativorans US6-1]
MTGCGCEPTAVETAAQRRVLWLALSLNAAMFVVEVTVGLLVGSTAVLADGLDMLSDATVYAIALAAIGRSARFKVNSARLSGVLLLALGIALLWEVARRLQVGVAPEGLWMMAVSLPALAVNVIVLRLLSHQRNGEVHLRAAWIFTRADVVANVAVIFSGLAVMLTGLRYFDLFVGAAIGVYVIREALEILKDARSERNSPA